MPDDHKLADGSGPIPSAAEALARLDEAMVEAMMTQRAVRRVRPDPVDDALVLRCIELSLRAPTGSNGQNWEFIVVKDPAVKRKLGKRYRQGWDLYYRSSVRKIAETDESMAKTARAVQWQVDHFAEIPVMIVACLRMSVREGKVPYLPMPHAVLSGFFGSIYPSVQNILLAARSMGLGASLITLPLWSQASARRALGLPTSVTPICVVPMGWPRGRYGPTTRRPVGEVVHLNTFGNRVWLNS
jgi:nitroreductase